MAFNFSARADSSDDDAPVDLSSWTGGVKRKRSTPPRRTSGFRAVNQPQEGLAMEVDGDPEPQPEFAAFMRAPVAKLQASADPMVISSGEEERSDDEDESPVVTPMDNEEVQDAEEDDREDKQLEEDDGAAFPGTDVEVYVPVNELDDEDLDQFEDYTAGHDFVSRVLQELGDEDGVMSYSVEFRDYHVAEISFDRLLSYTNGQNALEHYTNNPTPEPDPAPSRARSAMSSTRPRAARKSNQNGYVNTVDAISDDEMPSEDERQDRRRRNGKTQEALYVEAADSEDNEDDLDEDNEDEPGYGKPATRKRSHKTATGPIRRSGRSVKRSAPTDESDQNSSDEDGSDAGFLLQSDLPGQRGRGRPKGSSKRKRLEPTRQSERSTRHLGDMEDPGIDEIYRSDSQSRAPAKPKPVAAKEIFKQLPRNDEFRMRHSQQCEVCTNGSNYAPLIGCQGCTLSYHKQCLGHRTGREHLVTRIDEDDYVLQCRRCVRYPQKKDRHAPDQSKCQDCMQPGASCQAFRSRKTPAQEQREREENDGVDPSQKVDPNRINNADNVLFRCVSCWRGYHFEHLPSRSNMMEMDTDADAEQRFREYSRDWKCKDCLDMPAKVSGLIAWKPTDDETYDDSMGYDDLNEDNKTYLVRWDGHSYFRATWMPGAWVWGVTSASTRKAFAKRDENVRPKMRTEEAIPEDFLRADIVLDIKFTSIVDVRTQEIDKARIREVEKALIKYKGLSYEEAVWEAPPTPDDGERWTDFVTAYNDWVHGRHVHPPKAAALRSRLEKARKQDFASLEKQTQPDELQGGKLMQYQMEGLNWLYYKWFTQKNAILADEMGLGKTIQIIGFLATLVQDWNCYPFLIVVPNSTCPNWRREIKRWAPSLRVVAYYGSKESRDLAYRYEMFPENTKELRCHIVVTSYDAAADENCRRFFRSVQWQGLIVDEGQRLKSEKTQLYAALGALKAPFKILMTGTPLQNNQRELFNLLQFLDDSYKAAELEERFEELDKDKIAELHDMIRPFFLRRTKAQVLTFLPPMAQIIVPVSMTILQKKVYRTIIAKNPDLMKAIFSTATSSAADKAKEKGSLSNILMQLRKCLCHPFVYSRSIEERSEDQVVSHRNLVDASSKLKLLELLLPKLQERGHRVLIFSQFLDMLDMVEDFMDGMQMPYQRLDGSVSSLEKQRRIDEYNAPESPLFAFLLSTRAGGVGINLATADTVIILDPDFNPHQDIQALSRAHRIGQTKKVLCFQLVTRASAEEKIMQIGRKKLALDHVLIQEMDADDTTDTDLASILRHGANELFNDDGDTDIVYDPSGIERLLDRSGMEDTNAGGDRSAETSFSHARIWANDSGSLQQNLDIEDRAEEEAPDPGVWANILKERERNAAEEAAANASILGRGRRARGAVDYAGDKAPDGTLLDGMGVDTTPIKQSARKGKNPDESDTDFQAVSDAESGADEGKDSEDDEGPLDKDDVGIITKHATGDKKKAGEKSSSSTPLSRSLATPVTTHKGKKVVPKSMRRTPNKGGLAIKVTARKTPVKQGAVKVVAPKTAASAVKKSNGAKAPPKAKGPAIKLTPKKSVLAGKVAPKNAAAAVAKKKTPAPLMKESSSSAVATIGDEKKAAESNTPASSSPLTSISSVSPNNAPLEPQPSPTQPNTTIKTASLPTPLSQTSPTSAAPPSPSPQPRQQS